MTEEDEGKYVSVEDPSKKKGSNPARQKKGKEKLPAWSLRLGGQGDSGDDRPGEGNPSAILATDQKNPFTDRRERGRTGKEKVFI